MTQTTMIDGLYHQWRGPSGKAPLLVFANALGTDFRLWDRVIAQLPEDWGILRLDKRGHGLSTLPMDAEISIDSLATDIETLLDVYDVRRFVGVGLSVGGLIMQRLALRRAGTMTHLVLSDTTAKIGMEDAWNARIDAVLADGVRAVSADVLERWFPAPFHATDDFQMWRNMLERTSRHGYAAVGAAIRDADFRESLPKIAQATLVIAGEHDGSTPPQSVKQMAGKIPNARFAMIESSGHLPCVDRPTAFAQLLKEHLGAGGGEGD